jgi:ABC-type amino acid transport substrate-binding protein
VKRKLFLLIVFFLPLVYYGYGIAETLHDVKARGRLIAGVRTDFPPFGFVDKKGLKEGIDIDIARVLAKELFGKEEAVEFVVVTEANGAGFLINKKIDVLLGGQIIRESPEGGINYSVPYFQSGYLILVRDDSMLGRYQDLAGKNVAIIRGSTADTAIRELVPQANRIAFSDYSTALQALKERRVDALVDTSVMVIHLERRDPKLKTAGYQTFGSVLYGLGVRRGDKEWLNFLNATLTKIKETGQYEKLLEKWFARALAGLLGFDRPVREERLPSGSK